MILGVDLGNFATKTSYGLIFPSKCSRTGNLLKSTFITTEEDTVYIGYGAHDTEYRKIRKEHLRTMFLYAAARAGKERIKVVVGLPLSQYREDKESLKALLLFKQTNDIEINGKPHRIIIEDVEVYPEGLAAIYGSDYEGIVIDIGGRTTDCCEIIDGKASNPFSLPHGTLYLYSDFIKRLNALGGLDLKPDDADWILRKGLTIDGVPVDIAPALEVFKEFINNLIGQLQVEYSIHTRNILLIGGGCELLHKAIKNRLPAARIIPNPLFANAMGFLRVGESLWL